MPSTPSNSLRARLFNELDALPFIDPHTHINPHAPASTTLADILGYHYYTELAHSAGLPREEIEFPELDPREKVRRMVAWLGPLENTIQFSWLLEMAQTLFDFSGDHISEENWESLYESAQRHLSQPDWERSLIERTRLEGVFLTNDFDDPLTGFDTTFYIPCLRVDDLVFRLHAPQVRERLQKATGVPLENELRLRQALGKLVAYFVAHGARACAISLPPDFVPEPISAPVARRVMEGVFRKSDGAPLDDLRALEKHVFWTLTSLCDDYRLPMDLMIGVHRGVYESGVKQGQDLYDSRVSLIQYRRLLNAFPRVTFPISVLASVTNQELVSFAWIFPNVVTSGHWWYSNTPSMIERDLAHRLEAVPRTKQLGYYSDMYKLEFALPKFAMYKRVLAKVLAEHFVEDRNWPEERALDLGRAVLRDNTPRIFPAMPGRM